MKAKQAKINNLWSSKKKNNETTGEENADWCRLCGQTDEGDAAISLGYTLAEHNRTGTESVIRSEADSGGVQRQTDTQSLSKSGPSVVSQTDVDPPPRAPVGGVAGVGGWVVVGEAAARR